MGLRASGLLVQPEPLAWPEPRGPLGQREARAFKVLPEPLARPGLREPQEASGRRVFQALPVRRATLASAGQLARLVRLASKVSKASKAWRALPGQQAWLGPRVPRVIVAMSGRQVLLEPRERKARKA